MIVDKDFTEAARHVKLIDFSCTSTEVLNSVIDDISCSVGNEQDVLTLEIEQFIDRNVLQAWPLGQLVAKCSSIQTLKVQDLSQTTDNNRRQILTFVG